MSVKFQVIEYKDPNTQKVWKVELEYAEELRDRYGSVMYSGPWTTVPRITTYLDEPPK